MKTLAYQFTRVALLALVAVSLGTWGMRTFGAAQAASSLQTVLPADGLVVINFHGATRCNGCMEIGSTTEKVVQNDFANEVKSGLLSLKAINFEEAANKHFVQDYGLVSSTVVVVQRVDGRDLSWKRLDAVWDYLFEETQMSDYLRKKIAEVKAGMPVPKS